MENWPKFGGMFKVFNHPKFKFYIGTAHNALELAQADSEGLYFPMYNLIRTCEALSNEYMPDYGTIMQCHQDWLMRYKNGEIVYMGSAEFEGPRLDIGNKDYIDFAVDWILSRKYGEDYYNYASGLDNGMFMTCDPQWEKYDTNESWQCAWELFLKNIMRRLRPQHTIVLNTGSCDLEIFSRMAKWIDGFVFESFCDNFTNFEDARAKTLDKIEKGKWCADNNKIFAIRQPQNEYHTLRECFLFGYCATLMFSNKKSYFLIDEDEPNHPEMNWIIGDAVGEMWEYQTNVYRRDFQNNRVYLNLSDSAYTIPYTQIIVQPFNGAIQVLT